MTTTSYDVVQAARELIYCLYDADILRASEEAHPPEQLVAELALALNDDDPSGRLQGDVMTGLLDETLHAATAQLFPNVCRVIGSVMDYE